MEGFHEKQNGFYFLFNTIYCHLITWVVKKLLEIPFSIPFPLMKPDYKLNIVASVGHKAVWEKKLKNNLQQIALIIFINIYLF